MSANVVEYSIIPQFARNIQRTQVAQELANLEIPRPDGHKSSGAPLVPRVPLDDLLFKPGSRPENLTEKLKIGIIGTGIGGSIYGFHFRHAQHSLSFLRDPRGIGSSG